MQQKRYAGKLAAVLSVLCSVFFLTGCGEEKNGTQITGLQIGKDGRVTSNIVETFEKEFYTIEGLNAMIQEEITAYNANHPEAILLKTAELYGEDEVLVTMEYASDEDYMDFNKQELFFGTVAEAEAAGFELDVELVSVSDAAVTITKEDIAGMADSYILIIRENMQVLLPQKVLYMTAGTELINSKSINVQKTDGLTYVIMK